MSKHGSRRPASAENAAATPPAEEPDEGGEEDEKQDGDRSGGAKMGGRAAVLGSAFTGPITQARAYGCYIASVPPYVTSAVELDQEDKLRLRRLRRRSLVGLSFYA